MDLMVFVKYTCAVCGVHREAVAVRARTDEDVVEWLEQVAVPALMRDHFRRSPGCGAMEFAEVMIPVEGADRIGGASSN